MSKGNLLSVREDVRVLDATLRDGGICNDFYFTDEFVKDLYHDNIEAGVDYMEFGYKASKEMFDPDKFGKWKFCDDDKIREIVGDNNSPMKIAVMADVGRCDYKKDISPKAESPSIDMVRERHISTPFPRLWICWSTATSSAMKPRSTLWRFQRTVPRISARRSIFSVRPP